MLIPVLLLVQAAAQPPRPPQRSVPDPGVIATDQRVTPAGMQSVFEARARGSDMIGAPALLDAESGALLDTIALGVLPVAAVISADGRLER